MWRTQVCAQCWGLRPRQAPANYSKLFMEARILYNSIAPIWGEEGVGGAQNMYIRTEPNIKSFRSLVLRPFFWPFQAIIGSKMASVTKKFWIFQKACPAPIVLR